MIEYTQEAKTEMIETFEKALEQLGPNGEHWIKGQYRDGLGGMCLSEAIGGPRGIAYNFLNRQLGLLRNQVNKWNDAPERIFEEVKSELRKAIATLKA